MTTSPEFDAPAGRVAGVRRLEATGTLDDALSPYLEAKRSTSAGSWVLANMVGSLAGSAADAGKVGSLSTAADAALFRALRTVADVVLVGAETVRREGYGPVRLTDARQAARVAVGTGAVPPLAIVSRSLELDFGSAAFTEAAAPTIVITCAGASNERIARAAASAEVVVAGDERVEIDAALSALAERGLAVVLCEGGPTLLGELVASDLLDELCLTITPVLGGDALPVAKLPPGASLRRFQLEHVLVDADDALFLRYLRPGRGRA